MDLPSLQSKGPSVINEDIRSSSLLTQGKELRTIDYANEVYGLSKVKASMLRMYTKSHSTNAEYELFSRRHIRQWSAVTKSIDTTPNTPQTFDRRALFLNPYEDAIIVDKSDMVKSQFDVLSQAKVESAQALGRLQDSIILDGFLKPVYVQKATAKAELPDGSAVTANQNRLLTVENSLTKMYVDNVFYDDVSVELSDTRKGLVSAKDTIERVKHVLRKRAVGLGEIYCTLTPDLEYILMTDSEFNARERIFRPSLAASGKSDGGFIYRGVNFVRVADRYDIFPAVGVNWAGGEASAEVADNSSAAIKARQAANLRNKVVAKKLSKAVATIPIAGDDGSGGVTESDTPAKIGIDATNSTDADKGKYLASASRAIGQAASDTKLSDDHTVLTVQSGADVAVFWDAQAIMFGERSGDTFSRSAERPDLRHADQLYMRASFGSLVIDPECVMGLVVSGRTAEVVD